MAVSLTPALSQRERATKERAARDFHGKAAPTGERTDFCGSGFSRELPGVRHACCRG